MSANLIVGKDPTGNKVPVAVDAAGKIQIGGVQLDNLNVNTDQIEGKQDVTNALLTTQAADLAAVKTQLATGTIAVTGGGGGGGSGASAAYNATLPTYTSGASSTLQTDVNGRLITTGPELATIADEAILIDAKLPALSSGRVPVEANNAASQVFNYTATGAVAANTVLIGPIDCAQFREVSVQIVSAGTSFFMAGQISNDGTNWISCPFVNQGGTISSNAVGTATIYNYQLLGAKNFRVIANAGATAGTTTLVAYASQQATPKLYQSVSWAGAPPVSNTPNATVTSGFFLYHTLVSAASTNATSVKGSAGVIGTLILTNNSASWAYFKLCNTATAPTPGTTTAVINIGVAPNSTLDCSTAFAGLRLTTGIAYYVSAGTSLTDNTALPAAGTFLVNMTYV
jgi:hypothetical protein